MRKVVPNTSTGATFMIEGMPYKQISQRKNLVVMETIVIEESSAFSIKPCSMKMLSSPCTKNICLHAYL